MRLRRLKKRLFFRGLPSALAMVILVGNCASANLFTVSGTVKNLNGGTVVLQINGKDDLSLTINGKFTFPSTYQDGSEYNVTVRSQPVDPYQICTVINGHGTISGAHVTDVLVVCSTDTYSIGGTVSGLIGGTVVIQNNGGDDLSITADGSFTFPTELSDGSPYKVTVLSQPTSPNQTCTVNSGIGSLSSANVTNVSIICSVDTYTVSGVLNGIAGGTLVLQNNGGDDISLTADGAFTFPSSLASGSTYTVTVSQQPTPPNQTCLVTSGSGTIGSTNVTDVSVTCVTDTYTISGTVSGLSGGSLVLQNNGGDYTTILANGAFTFSTALNDGSTYNVAVLLNPTSPNQTCTVANGAGTLSGSNVTNVTVTCAINTYTIGGFASGMGGGTLVLQNNGGDNLNVSADGAFTFATPIADTSSYNVTILTQPTSPSQTCTLSNGSGTVAGSNVTSVSVSCTTNTFTIGGTVSGLNGTVVLQNNGGDNLTISANGSFTFPTPLADLSAYSVTVLTQPTSPNQTCTVSNAGGSLSGSNVTNVSVTCTTNTYTVGGTVSGLGAGSVVLQNNGGDNLTIGTDGTFTFATGVTDGTTYNVTVLTQPTSPSQTCTVSNGSGTIAGANVTNVSVSCTIDNFTIGGTVSGLAGGSVVLQNNGGDDLTVSANGAFTFATSLPDQNAYNVTVLTNPTSPNQTCTVSNASGTLSGSNVTNVSVSCVTITYTVGGIVSGLTGTVVLQNNGGDDLTVSSNGVFTFATALNDGSAYNVTVFSQPIGQECLVTRGSSNLSGTNTTDILVTCGTLAYTVGGTASGLTGTVILQNNGGDDLTVSANGAFTFATSLADASPYHVTVKQNSASEVCTLSKPTGRISAANVTNVALVCAADTNWVQDAYLKASNAEAGDYFGYALDISGDTLAVGAYKEASSQTTVTNTDATASADNSAADAGAVYVFKKDGTGNWIQDAYLKASNAEGGDYFGYSVAVDVDTIAVGAYREDSNETIITNTDGNPTANTSGAFFSGAVYVFKKDGTGNWIQDAYLKASNAEANDWFGYSVDVSGDTIAVGAYNEDANQTTITNANDSASADNAATNSGGVYVFQKDGAGNWYQEAYLKASNAEANDFMGYTVAISGNTIAAGAYQEASSQTTITNTDGTASANNSATDAGAVYIFRKASGNDWVQDAYLKASNAEASDLFGFSVAISGDTVVVGAYQEDSSQTTITNVDGSASANNGIADSGAAYIFKKDGSGNWIQDAYLKAPNGDSNDFFGYVTAIDGSTVVVTALREGSAQTTVTNANDTASTDNTAANAGAVYVFQKDNAGAWYLDAYLKPTNMESADVFGSAISVSGSTIAVGAYLEDSNATSVDNTDASASADNSALESGAVYIFEAK